MPAKNSWCQSMRAAVRRSSGSSSRCRRHSRHEPASSSVTSRPQPEQAVMVWWARFQPRHASHSHLFVRVAPQAKQSVQESTGG
jgi:hypothetical protein